MRKGYLNSWRTLRKESRAEHAALDLEGGWGEGGAGRILGRSLRKN
jgi:hypothetical protein